jgi:hypothetical protein
MNRRVPPPPIHYGRPVVQPAGVRPVAPARPVPVAPPPARGVQAAAARPGPPPPPVRWNPAAAARTAPAAPGVQAKLAPPPRLAPPPLPPPVVARPQPPPPAQAAPAPGTIRPATSRPAVIAPPPRVPPPVAARSGVVQGVLIDKRGGDPLDASEVDDEVKGNGLGVAGKRQLRAFHKSKVRYVLATAIRKAKEKDRPRVKGIKKKKKMATSPRAGKFTKVGLDRKFKAVTLSTPITFVGRWTPTVKISGVRSFTNDRDAQVLRHLSAQLFWYVRNELNQKGEQEVQAMAVNGRILVAANDDESMRKLEESLKSGGKGHLKKILEKQQEKDERSRTNALKLSRLFEGKRKFDTKAWSGVSDLIAIVANDAFHLVDISDEKGCIDALTNSNYNQKLILTVGGGELHAEQKLIVALYQAKQTGGTVFGKKRPCTACAATFKFANDKLNLKILHNHHHGGYWSTSNPGLHLLVGLAIQRKAVTDKEANLWLEDLVKETQSYQSVPLLKGVKRNTLKTRTIKLDPSLFEDTGYDSGSDSETE